MTTLVEAPRAVPLGYPKGGSRSHLVINPETWQTACGRYAEYTSEPVARSGGMCRGRWGRLSAQDVAAPPRPACPDELSAPVGICPECGGEAVLRDGLMDWHGEARRRVDGIVYTNRPCPGIGFPPAQE